MLVIFTDLDGTLLDHRTYGCEEARPALERLGQKAIPLVLTTSKTRAETEFWRARLANTHPFIIENGGAVCVPSGYFSGARPAGGEYEVVRFGDRYEDLVETLCEAAVESGVQVRGFHQMTAAEISARCELPLEQACLARQREFDEPFEILEAGCDRALIAAIERRGKRCTRGGRFYHVTGNNDKAAAVRLLCRRYGPVWSVGVGDGPNDAAFLNAVDVPVVMRSPLAADLCRAVPRARLTNRPGPEGWNQAILEILGQTRAPA